MGSNDVVDLAAAIGTWIAAAIAIAALVGVVGPYIALQASLSDRNRAMNAVQDFSGKYVTRGYRVARGMRVFRRIRVPNLAPSYITNEPEKTPLVPLAAVRGFWTLRARDYQPFNTGWAKLAELIEAYRVHEEGSNDAVNLAMPTDGTLEIVNSKTAFVVSKHWILLLGLLGRYGKRSDKGVLYKRGIRREAYGERILMRDIKNIWEYGNTHRKDMFEWVRKKDRNRLDLHQESDSDDSSSDFEIHGKLTVRRNAYGEWTVDRRPSPTLFGITGTMRGLGRQKGSWSYLSSMSFVPRSEREIFPPKGQHEKSDMASAETLFWIAHGFLPCGWESDGRRVVISLEDPDGVGDDASIPGNPGNMFVFDLQEADDVPLSIGNALRSLGLTEPKEPKVLRLLPYDGDIGIFCMPNVDTSLPVNLEQEPTISVIKSAISFIDPANGGAWVFPRNALERPVGVFLSLDWDPWGFLARKDKFFVTILAGTVGILRERFFGVKEFWEALDVSEIPTEGFQHDVSTVFSVRALADRMALDEALLACLDESEVLPLKLSLGALFALDDKFKEEVLGLAMLKDRVRGEEAKKEAEEKVLELLGKLKLLEEEHETAKAKAKHEADEGQKSGRMAEDLETQISADRGSIYNDCESEDSSEEGQDLTEPTAKRPLWTRMARKHVDEETLRALSVDYVPDEVRSLSSPSLLQRGSNSFPLLTLPQDDHVLIKREVPGWELDIFWSHTRTLRELQTAMTNATEHSLEYDYSTKELTWHRGLAGEREKVSSWSLEGELLRVPKTDRGRVKIKEKDILLICLWVANRAAMWIGSVDSKPLLNFVEELDPHVYVL